MIFVNARRTSVIGASSMKDRIIAVIFSLIGVSILIGVAGFLSAIVTMFVDMKAFISIKWIMAIFWISFTLVLILLKVIHDLIMESKAPAPYEHPIRYLSDEKILVIRRNENFVNSIVVGCYLQIEDVDRLAFIGAVHLVQDKVIQIKIYHDMKLLKDAPSIQEALKRIEIRPVVPLTAIQQLVNSETQND